MQNWSSQYADTVFNISDQWNKTLTVYRCYKQSEFYDLRKPLTKCNSTVYLALFDLSDPMEGCSMEHELVEVGRMDWLTNDTKRNDSCRSCQASDGICGYNFSDSSEPFVCYCKDGPRTHECPAHGRRTAIIIGYSIGGVAVTAIAVIFFTFYDKSRRTQPPRTSDSKVEKFLTEYAYQMPTRYSHAHLKKITNNFAEKLGEGGFGVVYKGKFRNGTLVAVKLLDRQRQSEAQFMNEVATTGRVHHVNLVRLLGYCFENPISALVYEYMVNGSLEKFIFARKEKGQMLKWAQVYDCEKRIIHFDIKPHNILLDAEFTPKVSDFGLAKLCGKGEDHVSMTGGRGTPGYVAPEVCDSGADPVTDKSDVYSFGMVLLEIVGGRKNIDWKASCSSQFYFPEWAFKLLESGELAMILRGAGGGEIEAEDEEKTRRLTKVGLWCIQYKSTDRPCMSRIVQMLEGNGDDVTNPPLTFNQFSAAEIPVLSRTGEFSSIEIAS